MSLLTSSFISILRKNNNGRDREWTYLPTDWDDSTYEHSIEHNRFERGEHAPKSPNPSIWPRWRWVNETVFMSDTTFIPSMFCALAQIWSLNICNRLWWKQISQTEICKRGERWQLKDLLSRQGSTRLNKMKMLIVISDTYRHRIQLRASSFQHRWTPS